ncbi:VWA domain-containing protein [Myxococcota bacterium]|nr:VWA domain-containing protein [Myxococcota bacterium]
MKPAIPTIVPLCALALAGCTDVELYRAPGLGQGPLDNKLAIRSSFCTEDPDELRFPVKILFVVDTSQSMARTDPTGERLLAVQDVVDAYIGDPGVELGIISFSGATNVLTTNARGEDGFTRDRQDIDTAIVSLGIAGSTTDYEGAISNVFRVLSADMQNADETELARSKYVVIFVSDGLPNPVAPPTNTRTSILDLVGDVMNLQRIYRPKEIRLHTALLLSRATQTGSRCTDSGLEGGDDTCIVQPTATDCTRAGCLWIGVEEEAESLLESMAQAGQGTFRSFPNGEQINFLKIDFTTIRRVFTLKNLIVSNANARPELAFTGPADRIGRATEDSDGDGLDDEDESRLGTDPTVHDTDGDGFNDLLEVRLAASGFDPLDPSDADCRLDLDRVDTDGDGLLDCEERFAGTSRAFFDSDADGVPDGLELRYLTNPVADDSKSDLDFDGARNADEIRGHSDPLVNDAADRSSLAYRYEVVHTGLRDDGRSCYDFEVENVTLASTLPDGENRIYIYVDQAPFDDPKDFGTFRVACVTQTYLDPDFRDPPFAEVEIPPEAFVRPTELDPDTDCVRGTPPVRRSTEEETP